MFVRLRDIKIGIDESEDRLLDICAKSLRLKSSDIQHIRIYKKSLDARRSRQISFIYSVDVYLYDETKYRNINGAEVIEREQEYTIPSIKVPCMKRPVVVGFGPAGMFCSLVLAMAGLRPIVIERGCCIEQRVRDVEEFFATGNLNTSSNIQFGEGGAGTFSDGKLNTLVKDKKYRGRFVLQQLVEAGAPEEILYLNKPHVGTDKLRGSMQNIREKIRSYGGEVLFETQLVGLSVSGDRICGIKAKKSDGKILELDTDSVFLGIGHSARDTFEMLCSHGIRLERKPFAVGVRIEHKQSMINCVQYNGAKSDKLPAADYKLVCHTSTGRTVYTFCMCPGGEVVAAASEEGMVVTNGMSNFARDGENANSALLVEVKPEDFEGDDVLAGMKFQRELEKSAYVYGGGSYTAPAQRVGDFLQKKQSDAFGTVKATYPRGVKGSDLYQILPSFITKALKEGIVHFDKLLHGFAHPDAVMTAVESRSSSPVRIVRDAESMQSELKGLYPIGEGAGYAGGIMSAAMDGMKAAEAYIAGIGSEE